MSYTEVGELDKKGAFVMEMYPEAKGKFYNPTAGNVMGWDWKPWRHERIYRYATLNNHVYCTV